MSTSFSARSNLGNLGPVGYMYPGPTGAVGPTGDEGPTGGPGPTGYPGMDLLYSNTLGTTATSFTAPAILNAYNTLTITGVLHNTVTTDNNITLSLQFNGDTGANYGFSSAVGSSYGSTGIQFSIVTSSGSTSQWTSVASSFRYVISNYSVVTTFYKSVNCGTPRPLANITGFPNAGIGYWASTAAITDVTLTIASGTFGAGSAVHIYGEI